MARQAKQGLDYFPFDVDFFDDDRIVLACSNFGFKGEVIAMKLLCKIYKDNGYYYQWGDDEARLFAKRVGGDVQHTLVNDIVHELIRRDFFDKIMFDRFKILTSSDIQERYLFIVKNFKLKRRSINQQYLLGDNSEFSDKNTEENEKNTEESTQKKTNENKEKESKTNQTKEKEIPPDVVCDISILDFEKFFLFCLSELKIKKDFGKSRILELCDLVAVECRQNEKKWLRIKPRRQIEDVWQRATWSIVEAATLHEWTHDKINLGTIITKFDELVEMVQVDQDGKVGYQVKSDKPIYQIK